MQRDTIIDFAAHAAKAGKQVATQPIERPVDPIQVDWEPFDVTRQMSLSLARSGIKAEARIIFHCWPTLHEASKKLSRLMTHHHPGGDNGTALLDSALQSAVAAYRKVLASDASDPTRPVRAYLMALLDGGMRMGDYAVFGFNREGAAEKWPAFDIPLAIWAADTHRTMLLFEERHNDAFIPGVRAKIAASILSLNDCKIMGGDYTLWVTGDKRTAP